MIKVGDRVKDIAFNARATGVVTWLTRHNPENPIEEHGIIEVLFDDSLDREHYAEYGWDKVLEIVTERFRPDKNV